MVFWVKPIGPVTFRSPDAGELIAQVVWGAMGLIFKVAPIVLLTLIYFALRKILKHIREEKQ